MKTLFQYKPLKEIDLGDHFFDSLRQDYDGFDAWYRRKANEGKRAFVLYGDQGLQAFIFIKSEINERVDDIEPPIAPCRLLKVGTLKKLTRQS